VGRVPIKHKQRYYNPNRTHRDEADAAGMHQVQKQRAKTLKEEIYKLLPCFAPMKVQTHRYVEDVLRASGGGGGGWRKPVHSE